MKFKLNKSEHYQYFNILKNIDKLSLQIKENKQTNNDSLVLLNYNNLLHIFVKNGIQSAYFNLNIPIDSNDIFAVDLNLFTNAFYNFPADEINFAFVKESNSLVFGNKKTKVSLNTSNIEDNDYIISFIKDENEYSEINNLLESLKYTSFSCSNMVEDYPYSSIMLAVKNDFFCSQSSDKHRISFYGNLNDYDKSYLISKNNADVLSQFIKEFSNCKYCISNNNLNINGSNGKFCTSLEFNNQENIFNKFKSFLEKSEIICEFTINKTSFSKSLKFISSVTKNETIDLTFSNNQILLSGNTNDKGMVADKIAVNAELPDLSSSYVENHISKVLDVFDNENIKVELLNYNDYNILKFSSKKFIHLIFPMV